MKPKIRLADLSERVAALERARAQENHQHHYRYSKHLTRTSDGWAPFWSWTCRDSDGIDPACPQPTGGTNHRGGLPPDFPDELR